MTQNMNQTFCQVMNRCQVGMKIIINKEGSITGIKEVVPVDKLINAIKKLHMSYNEEACKIIAETQRKANDSVAGRETIQQELLDFLMNLAKLMMSDNINMPCNKYRKLVKARTFRE